MKACLSVSLASIVLVSSAVLLAQDAVKVDPGHYKVLIDNASVRVLKVDYAPGEKSPMHQHPDAIAIPLGTAKVRFTLPDGKSEEREMPAGTGLYTPAATHSPMNAGTTRVDLILVEFKGAAPGTAALPTTRANMAMKVLAEGPRGNAVLSTADPAFQEPAGSKHDYDQVVIAMSAAQMSLSVDGKPAKTNWARGDVQFIGRGVAHESKNLSGKPVDFVIVAVK